MARPNASARSNNRNGAKPSVSKLGRELRRISDKIAVSGEKRLTRRELELEIAHRRSGNF